MFANRCDVRVYLHFGWRHETQSQVDLAGFINTLMRDSNSHIKGCPPCFSFYLKVEGNDRLEPSSSTISRDKHIETTQLDAKTVNNWWATKSFSHPPKINGLHMNLIMRVCLVNIVVLRNSNMYLCLVEKYIGIIGWSFVVFPANATPNSISFWPGSPLFKLSHPVRWGTIGNLRIRLLRHFTCCKVQDKCL